MPAQFVRRERKHRRLAKAKEQKRDTQGAAQDSNALELPAIDALERAQRRQQLAAELRPEAKISSKKKKRLDKYIDVKLRKDEARDLVKKLEAAKVDTSLFQSSKKLGQVHENKRERLRRALKERAAGINDGEDILFEQRVQPSEDHAQDASESEEGVVASPSPVKHSKSISNDQIEEQEQRQFGSGLKRPLQLDGQGQPMLKRRKRQPKAKAQISFTENNTLSSESDEDSPMDTDSNSEEEEEWEGFSSDSGASGSDLLDICAGSHEGSISGEESDSDEPVTERPEEKVQRASAFKQWADSQRNAAIGFKPSSVLTDMSTIKAKFVPRALSPDLVPQFSSDASKTYRPKGVLTIPRTEDVQSARLELPVVQEEQKIMEAVHNNAVVVVCGATGSGKTTQVPQMLLENGYGSLIGESPAAQGKRDGHVLQSYGMIGITQPRRVAATSVAERVAYELGSDHRNRVAHQVRYDTNVSKDTAIKFMTDGILLREIQHDFVLSRYSVVVVDEAHERSVNTDILIGILSRIVSLREQLTKEEPEKHYPLKMIIMSATLRINDFLANERLFKDGAPPVVEAEGRQYPVTVHFSRRTRRDYLDEMVEKVARGHKKLPSGAMLVFLTGQQEIQTVAQRLRERLCNSGQGSVSNGTAIDKSHVPLDPEDYEVSFDLKQPKDYMEAHIEGSDDDDGLDENGDEEFAVEDDPSFPAQKRTLDPRILPLYAALPAADQLRVFQTPPEGRRLIVLATNVAETSITIPGIRYVFDCGRSKEKKCDSSNVQTFEIDWISQASAAQRMGRAGRTGPGHCYRLYSSAVFENYFDEHTTPEILRAPLESTVLQLKAMEVDNVVNFPFPTPPDRRRLAEAERLLKNLGAIDERSGKITARGSDLAHFPLSPRYGVMLLLAERNKMTNKTVALVAGLAVGDLFVQEMQPPARGKNPASDDSSGDEWLYDDPDAQVRHQAYTKARATLSRWDDRSDAIKLLTAVAAHAEAMSTGTKAHSDFCANFFLREKGMQEVQQLRQQLHSIAMNHLRTRNASEQQSPFSQLLGLPSEKERSMLNQIVAAGFIDQIAVRTDVLTGSNAFGRKPRRAIEVAYRTLKPSSETIDRNADPETQELQRSVFIHPSSVLARLSPTEMPQYIVYSHITRAAASTIVAADLESNAAANRKKARIHPLATIGPKALAVLAEGTPLLVFGKPIGKIEELPQKRRQCWISISLRAPAVEAAAGVEWPLGAWKVLQKRNTRGAWEVDQVLAR